MKLDQIFWFLKKEKELSTRGGNKFKELFLYVDELEERKRKVIPELEKDFTQILRRVEEKFELVLKENWDGQFGYSSFYAETLHVGEINTALRGYTVNYHINKIEGEIILRVSAISEMKHSDVVCEYFKERLVDSLDPGYNEVGKFFIDKEKVEMVINFFPPFQFGPNPDDF